MDNYKIVGFGENPMTKICIKLISIYRKWISPLKKPSCRFYPSCSQYSLEAYETYGFFKGSYLTVKRISRCHPLHPGGYDPLKKL